MSRFEYKAEGELNSQYLLDLLKEYLNSLLVTNDTNGVQEDEYNIDPNKNWFVLLFKDVTTRLLNEDDIMDNYNRVLATEYVKFINTKIDVFMQTNILSPKQVWGLKQILKAIRFNSVIPLLERCREKAFRLAEKDLFKTISHIRGLRYSKSNYILFNSPVDELKPFLSDKVAEHNINTCALITLLKHFTSFKYKELNTFGFEPINVRFVAKKEDFYKDRVIDSGVGEEVEEFIWSKMMEKVEILKQGNKFLDDADQKIAEIDYLLKRLKLNKIEKMLQEIIVLKTNIAQAKEVVDSCMDLINTSVIPHKDKIFLAIDNMFYKLSKKCETLQQKAKQKLQLIDKEKIFEMVEVVEEQIRVGVNIKVKKTKISNIVDDEINTKNTTPVNNKPVSSNETDIDSKNTMTKNVESVESIKTIENTEIVDDNEIVEDSETIDEDNTAENSENIESIEEVATAEDNESTQQFEENVEESEYEDIEDFEDDNTEYDESVEEDVETSEDAEISVNNESNTISEEPKASITSNLYDDDDKEGEIDVSEDDDNDAEDEIVIDDEN